MFHCTLDKEGDIGILHRCFLGNNILTSQLGKESPLGPMMFNIIIIILYYIYIIYYNSHDTKMYRPQCVLCGILL